MIVIEVRTVKSKGSYTGTSSLDRCVEQWHRHRHRHRLACHAMFLASVHLRSEQARHASDMWAAEAPIAYKLASFMPIGTFIVFQRIAVCKCARVCDRDAVISHTASNTLNQT